MPSAFRAIAAGAAVLFSLPSLARGDGWEARYRLARRGLIAFAERAPNRLLLTSNESGAFQLETRDISRGKRYPLTHGSAGRTAGAISPDGKFVYYVEDSGGSEVGAWVRVPFEGGPPEPVAPGIAGSSTGIAFDSGGRFIVIGTSGADGFRFDRIDRAAGKAGDVSGGKPATLYQSKNEAYGPALSADGKYLSLVETERRNDRHYATLILDAATGQRVAELWDGEGNSVTAGRWSPVPGDERLLVNSDSSGFLRPAIYDLGTRSRVSLGAQLPGEMTAEDWSADARTVLLKRHAVGRDRLYLVAVGSKKIAAVETGEGSIGGAWMRPNGRVWAMFQKADATPRLLEDRAASGPVTIFASDEAPPGTSLAAVDFRGARGETVVALLGRPAKANGSAIVWLHGGPHSETGDTFSPALQAYMDEGFTVLAPNYHGSSGLGRDWANSVVGDPMRLELDDFRAARSYLLKERFARPASVFIAGWSYGGYGALSALAQQPELWAGGIAGTPITDFAMQYEDARAALRGWTVMLFGGTPLEKPDLYRDRSPLARAEAVRAPVLILAGRNDLRAPARQVEAFVEKLTALKKDVSVRWFDAGHGSLSIDEQIAQMRQTLAFLGKTVGAKAPETRKPAGAS